MSAPGSPGGSRAPYSPWRSRSRSRSPKSNPASPTSRAFLLALMAQAREEGFEAWVRHRGTEEDPPTTCGPDQVPPCMRTPTRTTRRALGRLDDGAPAGGRGAGAGALGSDGHDAADWNDLMMVLRREGRGPAAGDRALVGGVDAGVSAASSSSGICLLYTSPSPRDATLSRMPSSA